MSGFLKLNLKDLSKGLVVAILGAVLISFKEALDGNGLEFASYDWKAIFDFAWQAATVYLAKNLLTDSQGKVLGKF